MDKRIEKLSELTGRTTGSILMNKNNDNLSLNVVFQFSEWLAEQAFKDGFTEGMIVNSAIVVL